MASLKNAVTIAAPFANARELRRVVYDFSLDGGSTGDLTVYTASGACLVRCLGVYVTTAPTSGGSATLDFGKGTTGTEFVSTEAIATFAVNTFYASESNSFIKLADAEILNFGINTAALTAGVLEFIIEVIKI